MTQSDMMTEHSETTSKTAEDATAAAIRDYLHGRGGDRAVEAVHDLVASSEGTIANVDLERIASSMGRATLNEKALEVLRQDLIEEVEQALKPSVTPPKEQSADKQATKNGTIWI
ncbi:MAG: hypothetical protein QM756_16470 [Polyangiaceae bacterium]